MTAYNTFTSMVGANCRLDKLRKRVLEVLQEEYPNDSHRYGLETALDKAVRGLGAVISEVQQHALNRFITEHEQAKLKQRRAT